MYPQLAFDLKQPLVAQGSLPGQIFLIIVGGAMLLCAVGSMMLIRRRFHPILAILAGIGIFVISIPLSFLLPFAFWIAPVVFILFIMFTKSGDVTPFPAIGNRDKKKCWNCNKTVSADATVCSKCERPLSRE